MSFKTPIQLSEFNQCPENYYRASNVGLLRYVIISPDNLKGFFMFFNLANYNK